MRVLSYVPGGYRGHLVTVEVDCRTGIPGMDIVGLPGSEVREARDRVRVAIRNSGFGFPQERILVNLSPSDVPKSGNGFDLAIAIALLVASQQIGGWSADVMVVGELFLSGAVGAVRGAIAAVAEAQEAGTRRFIVPEANLAEARTVADGWVAGLGRLEDARSAVAWLAGPDPGSSVYNPGDARSGPTGGAAPLSRRAARVPASSMLEDYGELRGHAGLKRVLEISAAGGHHVLLTGPPGSGKSAAVLLLPTILPPLTRTEAIEVTRIHSLAGEPMPPDGLIRTRPFRAPHHTSSPEGLLGGGPGLLPGEVSLAHRGVLFLDEALEFHRPSLQGLREPLERRQVRIVRASMRAWYPAAFQLILACNPCPCGLIGRDDASCMCGLGEVERYWRRLGAPLLDRIELRLTVTPSAYPDLPWTDPSSAMAERVAAAVRVQERRLGPLGRNADLRPSQLAEHCLGSPGVPTLIRRAVERLGLSTRATLAVQRVARTIADLDRCDAVTEEHVAEAISYRTLGEREPIWRGVLAAP